MATKKHKRSTSPEQVNAFYQALVRTTPAVVRKRPFAAADMIDYFLAMEEIANTNHIGI